MGIKLTYKTKSFRTSRLVRATICPDLQRSWLCDFSKSYKQQCQCQCILQTLNYFFLYMLTFSQRSCSCLTLAGNCSKASDFFRLVRFNFLTLARGFIKRLHSIERKKKKKTYYFLKQEAALFLRAGKVILFTNVDRREIKNNSFSGVTSLSDLVSLEDTMACIYCWLQLAQLLMLCTSQVKVYASRYTLVRTCTCSFYLSVCTTTSLRVIGVLVLVSSWIRLIDLNGGRSGLSTWKYQFLHDH